MAKAQVSAEYFTALQKFAEKFEADQQKMYDDEGKKGVAVKAVIESGRKFDKVLLAEIHTTKKSPVPQVRYFVERASGNIYGPKSPMAPNLRWFFGTIYNAAKWDWSGQYGKPVKDNTVREVGSYGDYVHYTPVDEAESPDAELAETEA